MHTIILSLYQSGNKLPQTMIHNWVLTTDCAGIKKTCEEVTPIYNLNLG